MRRMMILGLMPLAGCVAVQARVTDQPAREITRSYAAPNAMFARNVVIPPGYETIRLAGIIPDAISPGVYGDTERQTESVLAKIEVALAEAGASEADVVAATVYLVAPPGQAAMDFAGMNRAYSKRYGSPEQPNRPTRSTVQVVALAAPGALVEIEVTAARKPR